MIKKIIFVSMAIFIIPISIFATGVLPSCIDRGSCSLDEGFQTFVTMAKWSLGIIGSVALLYFVIGGITWLSSGGNSDKIKKGRDIMINTTIGMLIILGAWLFVNTILTSLNKGSDNIVNLEAGVQSNACAGASDEEKRECQNNTGICIKEVCQPKCGLTTDTVNKTCREKSTCQESSIITNQCFGGADWVCCLPKSN